MYINRVINTKPSFQIFLEELWLKKGELPGLDTSVKEKKQGIYFVIHNVGKLIISLSCSPEIPMQMDLLVLSPASSSPSKAVTSADLKSEDICHVMPQILPPGEHEMNQLINDLKIMKLCSNCNC